MKTKMKLSELNKEVESRNNEKKLNKITEQLKVYPIDPSIVFEGINESIAFEVLLKKFGYKIKQYSEAGEEVILERINRGGCCCK